MCIKRIDSVCIRRYGMMAMFLLSFFPMVSQGKMVMREVHPAADWYSAMPIGNGYMGVMIYGGCGTQQIQFNQESFCTGSKTTMGSYQPFGRLFITMADSVAIQYERTLSLEDAVCRIDYQTKKASYQQEMLASYPADVIAVRYTSSKNKNITATVRLLSSQGDVTSYTDGDGYFTGSLPNGLDYEARFRVVQEGGKLTRTAAGIEVNHANTLTIYLSAATSFVNDHRVSFMGGNPVKHNADVLAKATAQSYETLRNAHIADYQSLYDNFHLQLGDNADSEVPVLSRRLQAYQKGAQDTWLETLLCQYGRYLLISSSRTGTLPANLQGKWNEDFKPAWYSQYTTDINIEMNYWCAEPTGLSACHLPLFDWIENIAAVQKESSDSKLQTPIAWKAYSTMNLMGGSSKWAINLPGPAWMLQHYWLHYAYTGDKDFMLHRGYPLLKEMTEFWCDRLILKDGYYVTPDGWSPEHGPHKKEGERIPYPGVSYDQEIIYDLLSNYIDAADALGQDPAFCQKVKDIRAKLLVPRIGRWGQLQEWMDDVDDPTDHHRHFMHLFGVYPGRQFSPAATPEHVKAAVVSLNARGDQCVGWSDAWRIGMFANLHQADRAYKFTRQLITSCVYPNLFSNYDLHSHHSPFQIEANFGYTAGVVEMLLQNEQDYIELLPALPAAWKDGAVTGVRVHKGFIVDMKWKDSQVVSLKVTSRLGGICKLQLPDGTMKTVSTEKGKSYQVL